MIRAVLDTNVLVSTLLKGGQGGIPDQILWRADEYELCLSEAILGEADRVLHYPRIQRKYRLSDEEIAAYLTYLRAIATMATDLPEVEVIAEDLDDNAIVASALTTDAGSIVSGDPHLLALESYQGVGVMRPAEFLAWLDAADDAGMAPQVLVDAEDVIAITVLGGVDGLPSECEGAHRTSSSIYVISDA